jgi:hypothetical protein
MKLYKYYSVNGRNLVALINRQFWASKPRSFNDPYDTPVRWMKVQSSIAMRTSPDNSGRLVRLSSERQPTRNFTEEEIAQVESMGVISFSSKNDEMLLWSHYADQHKGYALEFEVTEKLNKLNNPCFFKVQYDPAEYIHHHERYRYATQFKDKAWEYESEYRYLLDEGDQLYSWDINGGAFSDFTGIIFGHRMPESDRRALMKIVESINPEISFHLAALSKEEFKLEIIPL